MSTAKQPKLSTDDKKILVGVVKAERVANRVLGNHVLTEAQKRAIRRYEDHLEKVQKKLNNTTSMW